MVSYYNTLSSMFPSAHHPGAQPHPIASGRHGSAHSPAVVAAAAAQVRFLHYFFQHLHILNYLSPYLTFILIKAFKALSSTKDSLLLQHIYSVAK